MVSDRFRPLRGAVRNALMWGVGWTAFGFGAFSILRLTGILTRGSLLDGLGLAVRFGIVGVITGAAFSAFISLVYRGRRLSDISWVRFGIAGGVVAGVFVPLFLQGMNVLTGGGMIPWHLVLDDGPLAAVFGAIAAGGSLKLAQRVEALSPGKSPDELDDEEVLDRLPSARARDRSSR